MSLKKFGKTAAATAAAALMTSFGSPLAIGAALALPGCFVFGSPGPSAVGQGQKYESGSPEFDAFFAELYELQVEMVKAPGREKEIRQEIAKVTKSDPDASASLLAKKVDKHTKELAEAGTGLALSVEGLEGDSEATVAFEAVGKDLSADDKAYFDAVEKAAKEEAKLLTRMRQILKRTEAMKAQTVALEQQIDGAFRKGGPSKKSEVRKNLEDSRTLIPLMQARAQETADTSKAALKKLAEAINTKETYKKDEPPPPPEAPPEEPPEEGTGTKPKPKPAPGPGPATQPKPQPQPQPQPKPPPSDFEP